MPYNPRRNTAHQKPFQPCPAVAPHYYNIHTLFLCIGDYKLVRLFSLISYCLAFKSFFCYLRLNRLKVFPRFLVSSSIFSTRLGASDSNSGLTSTTDTA